MGSIIDDTVVSAVTSLLHPPQYSHTHDVTTTGTEPGKWRYDGLLQDFIFGVILHHCPSVISEPLSEGQESDVRFRPQSKVCQQCIRRGEICEWRGTFARSNLVLLTCNQFTLLSLFFSYSHLSLLPMQLSSTPPHLRFLLTIALRAPYPTSRPPFTSHSLAPFPPLECVLSLVML